jgi:amino-acid N-acetyltransferase
MGLEFLVRIEQQRIAAQARIETWLEQATHLGAESAFRARMAGDGILLFSQLLTPLCVRLDHLPRSNRITIFGEFQNLGPFQHVLDSNAKLFPTCPRFWHDGVVPSRHPSTKNPKSVTVRPAERSDLQAIRQLIRLYPKQLVQQNLPRVNSFFIASISGKPVGCCALQIYSTRLAEVRSLSVHPDFQDDGIASLLVESCKQRARERGVREIFAVTSQSSFFERLGFSTFRREKTAMFLDVTVKNG